MNIALYISSSEKAQKAAFEIINSLKSKNCGIFVPNFTDKEFKDYCIYADYKTIRENCGIIISLGGDGTFLRSAEIAIGHDIKLFGFNLGNLGFLTEAPIEKSEPVLDRIIAGDYKTKEKLSLECCITENNNIIFKGNALNEVTIHSDGMKLLNLSFSINNIYAGTYRADGLVIASPTGSTAYSLSAGGPIVDPKVGAFIIIPICPYKMGLRPFVVSDRSKIKVKLLKKGKNAVLVMDGQVSEKIDSSKEINAVKSDNNVYFVRTMDRYFYQKVKEKLNESRSESDNIYK